MRNLLDFPGVKQDQLDGRERDDGLTSSEREELPQAGEVQGGPISLLSCRLSGAFVDPGLGVRMLKLNPQRALKEVKSPSTGPPTSIVLAAERAGELTVRQLRRNRTVAAVAATNRIPSDQAIA